MKEHEFTALSQLNGLVLLANGELGEQVLYDTLVARARDVLGIEAVAQASTWCINWTGLEALQSCM